MISLFIILFTLSKLLWLLGEVVKLSPPSFFLDFIYLWETDRAGEQACMWVHKRTWGRAVRSKARDKQTLPWVGAWLGAASHNLEIVIFAKIKSQMLMTESLRHPQIVPLLFSINIALYSLQILGEESWILKVRE